MEAALTETQRDLIGLATDVFTRRATVEQVTMAEIAPDAFDHGLWDELCRTGLTGVVVPESEGGLGFGVLELALVLEQLGAAVAPVPLLPTAVAALLIDAHGSDEQRKSWLSGLADGSVKAAIAPPQSVLDVKLKDGKITAHVTGVAWAHIADILLLPVGDEVIVVEPSGHDVNVHRGLTTAREIALDLHFGAASYETVGGPGTARWLRDRWFVALAATAAGVTDAALKLTASYTSQREQFEKPLSTFQGVALKAADAYLDVVAIRAAARQAAWKLAEGSDATLEVLTAAWWAAEAGQHCVHITQHLHGGMGADITYPVHRYFLWGKQIELLTGGASALLAELGDALDQRADAGDAVVL
jgi:acyl-CoA dehydrogenase